MLTIVFSHAPQPALASADTTTMEDAEWEDIRSTETDRPSWGGATPASRFLFVRVYFRWQIAETPTTEVRPDFCFPHTLYIERKRVNGLSST